MTTNENLVLNLPYNEIYDRIVMLKKGAYQLNSNNEDDVENCKWLAAIFDVFIDLPLYVSTSILFSAADALVIAIEPTEKTVIAESTPAMILVLMVFVFFMLFTPFEFVVLVLVVVMMFVFFIFGFSFHFGCFLYCD